MARYAQSSSENISVQLGVGAAVVSGDVLYRDSDGLIKPLPNSESSLTVPTITETWRSNDISADNTGSNTGVCVLTSGDIVFLFRNATTVKFARYNPSGVLQGSVTTVETGLSGIVTMAICALTGGGFAIAYNNTSSTVRAAVYNSTGGVVKAAYQVAAYNASSIDIKALLTGDFVVAYNNTSSGLFFTRYDSTGMLLDMPEIEE